MAKFADKPNNLTRNQRSFICTLGLLLAGSFVVGAAANGVDQSAHASTMAQLQSHIAKENLQVKVYDALEQVHDSEFHGQGLST